MVYLSIFNAEAVVSASGDSVSFATACVQAAVGKTSRGAAHGFRSFSLFGYRITKMKQMLVAIMAALFTWSAAGFFVAELPQPLAAGLMNPESVCYGPGGVLYVTEMGVADQAGDGRVSIIERGAARPFATGLDDPKAIVFYRDEFYVTDRTKIVKIDLRGNVNDYATPKDFPVPPKFLNDIAIDQGAGIFLVSDSGDLKGSGGAVYRIDIRLHKIETIVDQTTLPELHTPNGVAFDGGSAALVADFGTGNLYRVRVEDKLATKIASGMDGADGLVWDNFGRLFITSWKTGNVFAIPRPGREPIQIGRGLHSAADAALDAEGKHLLVPDMKAGTLLKLSTEIPGWQVDDAPLAIGMQPAFTKLTWTGWDDGSEVGKTNALRPVLLTHAGDGTNRLYTVIQQGTIHTFPNDTESNGDAATATKIFLDITDRVRYSDKANEEGLLGLAFHPKFRDNGEFFVFYTDSRAKMANVVSRFRVKSDDPSVADPKSEEELYRVEKPYDNHNGGTITFGPDGYLYISHGDGGSGGDPQRNGQNLANPFGKVLRIDVNTKSGTKNTAKPYGIPADNPFVAQTGAMPEIWCYGLRNVWRMAFDKQTGRLWAGDVGQGLFEEVDILKSGANFGWSYREGLHPFNRDGNREKKGAASDGAPSDGFTEPVWEYHHNLGPSITGGVVYHGSAIPELDGAFLYGDYVSNRIWALRYDDAQGRVVSNRLIKGSGVPIMSFGEDERGEVYVMGLTTTGRGIFRLVRADSAAKR